MAERLFALNRRDVGGVGSLLPAPTSSLDARIIEPCRVISLRHLSGGITAIETAVWEHAHLRLPTAGHFEGQDSYLLWRSPSEWLLITPSDEVADGLLRVLPTGTSALACAVDHSAGSVIFELTGAGVTTILPRLLDAGAIPQKPGQGTRTRLIDIAVIALRLTADHVLLLTDRSNDQYMAHWLTNLMHGASTTALPSRSAIGQ
jgi:heterotetrameric sarcosine oxidase gamma subunit